MKKKQIIVLGVVLGLALVGLIIMQARYFQTAFKESAVRLCREPFFG